MCDRNFTEYTVVTAFERYAFIAEVNKESHAIIDGLKRRGLFVKEQLSPAF